MSTELPHGTRVWYRLDHEWHPGCVTTNPIRGTATVVWRGKPRVWVLGTQPYRDYLDIYHVWHYRDEVRTDEEHAQGHLVVMIPKIGDYVWVRQDTWLRGRVIKVHTMGQVNVSVRSMMTAIQATHTLKVSVYGHGALWRVFPNEVRTDEEHIVATLLG